MKILLLAIVLSGMALTWNSVADIQTHRIFSSERSECGPDCGVCLCNLKHCWCSVGN